MLQSGHEEAITTHALSSDGHLLATYSHADRLLKVWELDTGRILASVIPDEAVYGIGFRPDNRLLLLVGDLLKSVQVFDWQSEQVLTKVSAGSPQAGNLWMSRPEQAVFDPSGRLFAAIYGSVVVDDLSSGRRLLNLANRSRATAVAVSPNGQHLAVGFEDQSIGVWDISSGQKTAEMRGHHASEEHAGVRSLAFSPDSRRLASGGADGAICFWDVATGRQVGKATGHNGWVTALCFSPDGRGLASGGGDLTLRRWQAPSGQAVGKPLTLTNRVARLCLRPADGALAAITLDERRIRRSESNARIEAAVWQPASRKPPKAFSLVTPKTKTGRFAVSPNGRLFAAASTGDTVQVWDWQASRQVMVVPSDGEPVWGLMFSSDGRVLATGTDRATQVWDTESQQRLAIIGHALGDGSTWTSLSPDGRTLAVQEGGGFALYDARSGKRRCFILSRAPIKEWPQYLTFSPDGRFLVSGVQQRLTRWDTNTGRLVDELALPFKLGSDVRVLYSPNGQYLVVRGDGMLIFDLAHPPMRVALPAPLCRGDLSWDVSGTRLAVGTKLLDPTTGKQVGEQTSFLPAGARSCGVVGGRFLASSNADGTATLWDMRSQRQVLSFVGLQEGRWVAFTPDGHFEASPGAARMVSWKIDGHVFTFDQLWDRFFVAGLMRAVLSGNADFQASAPANAHAAVPPTVEILAAIPETQDGRQQVRITARFTDRGGSIHDIRLYHQGKLVTQEEPPAGSGTTRPYERQFLVQAVSGANEFRVTAYSRDRIESIPATCRLAVSGQKKLTVHLLAIGVNQYQDLGINQLNFAANDATHLSSTFTRNFQKLALPVQTTTIIDRMASKTRIMQALREAAGKAGPDDVFMLVLSGHGHADEQGVWYFIPNDFDRSAGLAAALSSLELKRALQAIPARKQFVIVDSCHSGAFATGMRAWPVQDTAIAQLGKAAGVHLIAASQSQETALEHGALKHGLLAFSVLLGLEGEADLNRDRIFQVDEIVRYVDMAVPLIARKAGHIQHPVCFSQGASFPIGIR
jgi:WD40 repeat protein